MLRRIHVPRIRAGKIVLDTAQTHHALRVLRLESGSDVELFDDLGDVASGKLIHGGGERAEVVVEHVSHRTEDQFQVTIASAVPKGERADWMIEKLSELGISRFIPLAAKRSVVLPEGTAKRQRWMRIAVEAAKQSRRKGVMQIEELTALKDLLARFARGSTSITWYLSTTADATPISDAVGNLAADSSSLTLLIGPEGGWTDGEVADFGDAGLTPVALTKTILRVETAAIAGAAVISTLLAARLSPNRGSA